MAFGNDAWATVWEVRTSEKYTDVRINTSRRNKTTGNYEQDFSGFIRCVGAAKAKADKLQARDRIKLGNCAVSSSYNKEKKITNYTFLVFDFEEGEVNQDDRKVAPSAAARRPAVAVADEDDEPLPF